MKVLVTGGLGFIGSHTVVELQSEGFEVIIVDDLSNSSLDVLDGITAITSIKPTFENMDLRCKKSVQGLFEKYQDIERVIHFAASKAIGESFERPLLYYENNLTTLIHILQGLENKKNPQLIFSSSCTVYGQAKEIPITEVAPIQSALSPYGNTKQIGEEIIADTAQVTNISAVLLRYFNPIGAHESCLIGELPLGVPQNLIPFITQTAIGLRDELAVFGDDYDTVDGTCVRDYIHVVDLAKAHVAALKRLINKENLSKIEDFNIGMGTGTSVLEIIESFERVNSIKLPYKIVNRRRGDIAVAYADTKKANDVLGWKATKTLDEALSSAWRWQQLVSEKAKI
ncbi:UDP-glucose 4-epimerase GalE [Myroides guanonis]|uniref:UDP-glucose 4-epimerase n=1 Tax=Myroides guanonis TaxID=1150112 RepID=A0A1I3L6Q9_9FLAO|nr:UDP-glucose 4-epimerase GalE [Myroides guanonis]SFI80462.1 UDP-glucose 4-epimerase [Myroides guanonis]